MMRAQPLLVALALSGCQLIGATSPAGFRCEGDGTCQSAGLRCCPDGFCRADCSSSGNTGGGTGGGDGGGTSGVGGGTSGVGGGAGGVGGGAGGGSECTAGLPCTSNPSAPCRAGATSCSGAATSCDDANPTGDGQPCATGKICAGGSCIACTDGLPCSGNPGACVQGVVSCGSSGPQCNDGVAPRDAGIPCGTNKVCSPGGSCVDCFSGSACSTNPSPTCLNGTIDCSSGASVCQDATPKALGATCGSGHICDGDGGCIVCITGSACATNPDPCKTGKLDCTSGAACNNDQPKDAGASCGAGQVCSAAGACAACDAGMACSNNPTACKNGVVDCSTGAGRCLDAATNRSGGTMCGTNKVCDGSGQCITCTTGASCTSNPSPCKAGTQSCSAGAPACDDTATNLALGASCPNGFCDGSGVCVPCALGTACTGNPTAPCKSGLYARSGTACVCADGAAANENLGCAASMYGTYGACSYATFCANTGSQSRTKTDYLCKSGTCTPVNGMDSMVCSRNQDTQTCSATTCGSFGACGYATECATSGSQSRTCTSYACSGGNCNGSNSGDSAMCTRTTLDTACTGGFCNQAETCVPCSGACSGNPDPCKAGISQWSSATHTCSCVDGAALPEGSSCMAGSGRCHAGACCTGCWDSVNNVCQGSAKLHCGLHGMDCFACNGSNCNCISGACSGLCP